MQVGLAVLFSFVALLIVTYEIVAQIRIPINFQFGINFKLMHYILFCQRSPADERCSSQPIEFDTPHQLIGF